MHYPDNKQFNTKYSVYSPLPVATNKVSLEKFSFVDTYPTQ